MNTTQPSSRIRLLRAAFDVLFLQLPQEARTRDVLHYTDAWLQGMSDDCLRAVVHYPPGIYCSKGSGRLYSLISYTEDEDGKCDGGLFKDRNGEQVQLEFCDLVRVKEPNHAA